MGLTFMFFLNSVLFGVGLAMDAFSVSLAAGMNERTMTPARKLAIAGTFALFQTAMPLIGWLCVHTIADEFTAFQKFIPWIALVLLLFIGGKMLLEGIREGDNISDTVDTAANADDVDNTDDRDAVSKDRPLTLRTLLLMGLATSIDALSVGFTIAELPFPSALIEAAIIGAVTLCICLAGLALGRLLGMKLAAKASIFGGLILIAIGLELLISNSLIP